MQSTRERPQKGLPQEEVRGHQDQPQAHPRHSNEKIKETQICVKKTSPPPRHNRTLTISSPSSRSRKRRRSSYLPSLDCTGSQVPAQPGCTPTNSHQGEELHLNLKKGWPMMMTSIVIKLTYMNLFFPQE